MKNARKNDENGILQNDKLANSERWNKILFNLSLDSTKRQNGGIK